MKRRTVFLVDIFVVCKNGKSFKRIAKNLEIKEPVWYNDKVMRKALFRDNPSIETLLKEKSWTIEVKRWF